MKIPSRDECREMWLANKQYVEFMGEELNISEAVSLSKKQNALYLAWFDGDFSELLRG